MSHKYPEIDAAFLLAIGGLSFLGIGWSNFRRTRKIKDNPTSKAASAAQGKAEFQGYAWPVTPFKAPISGTSVVYFQLIVEEYINNGEWREVLRETTNNTPFYLVDESGLILVQPQKKVETEIEKLTQRFSEMETPKQEKLLAYIQKSQPGYSTTRTFGIAKEIRFRETAIIVGSKLYAYGFFETKASVGQQLSPAIGLLNFMDQAFGAKKSVSIDAGSASIAVNDTSSPPSLKERNELICYGGIRELEDEPLYLANCWQDELLDRVDLYNGTYMVCGALMLAALAMDIYLIATGYFTQFH